MLNRLPAIPARRLTAYSCVPGTNFIATTCGIRLKIRPTSILTSRCHIRSRSSTWPTASGCSAHRYAIRGDVLKTEFAIAPERQMPGSDLDTFHDPNDDIVVSGTAGDV